MTGVTWTGLDALALRLRSVSADVATEAARVVRAAAQDHLGAVQAAFPQAGTDVTGNLRRGHTLVQTGPLTYRTRNRAPHAHLYEHGYTHVSGRPVAGHDVYVPAAQAIRARMVTDLTRVLDRVATRGGVLEVR